MIKTIKMLVPRQLKAVSFGLNGELPDLDKGRETWTDDERARILSEHEPIAQKRLEEHGCEVIGLDSSEYQEQGPSPFDGRLPFFDVVEYRFNVKPQDEPQARAALVKELNRHR